MTLKSWIGPCIVSVPRTDTGVPKVRSLRRDGVIKAREFGKLAPYLRYKGCQSRKWLVAVTRELRLFNKNIGGSESERMCIAAESCSVSVSEARVQPEEGPINSGGNYDPLKVA